MVCSFEWIEVLALEFGCIVGSKLVVVWRQVVIFVFEYPEDCFLHLMVWIFLKVSSAVRKWTCVFVAAIEPEDLAW